MKLTTLSTLAALTLAAAPAVAFAQDTTKTTKDSVSVKTQTTKTSAGDVAAPLNSATVIAAISAPGAAADQIKNASVAAAMKVQVADVSPLAMGADAKAFNEAREKGKADLPKLQSAIASNLAVSAALKAAATPALTSADILGATVGADGTITLYYHRM